MKTLHLLLVVLAWASNGWASDNSKDEADEKKMEVVERIIESQGVEKLIEQTAIDYEHEIQRTYKNVDNAAIKVFITRYKAMMLASYHDAYFQLPMSDLSRLMEFYSTEQGRWLLDIKVKLENQIHGIQRAMRPDLNKELKKILTPP